MLSHRQNGVTGDLVPQGSELMSRLSDEQLIAKYGHVKLELTEDAERLVFEGVEGKVTFVAVLSPEYECLKNRQVQKSGLATVAEAVYYEWPLQVAVNKKVVYSNAQTAPKVVRFTDYRQSLEKR
jgi:hypothetical protein